MIFFGRDFLNIFFGLEFQQAYSVLLLLVLSACITIVGFCFDPALYAMGLPGLALRVNAFVVVLVFVFVFVLIILLVVLSVGVVIVIVSSSSSICYCCCCR